MHAAGEIETNIRAERRRLRACSHENPAVRTALGYARDQDIAADVKRRRMVADLHKDVMTKTKLKHEIREAEALLAKKKAQIAEQEQLIEARHSVKQFSLQYLGDGDPNCGRAQGRKNRHEVLDRMSRLGTGLSPEQRNDWSCFKNEWDHKMLLEHGAAWVRVFTSSLQGVLDELDRGAERVRERRALAGGPRVAA